MSNKSNNNKSSPNQIYFPLFDNLSAYFNVAINCVEIQEADEKNKCEKKILEPEQADRVYKIVENDTNFKKQALNFVKKLRDLDRPLTKLSVKWIIIDNLKLNVPIDENQISNVCNILKDKGIPEEDLKMIDEGLKDTTTGVIDKRFDDENSLKQKIEEILDRLYAIIPYEKNAGYFMEYFVNRIICKKDATTTTINSSHKKMLRKYFEIIKVNESKKMPWDDYFKKITTATSDDVSQFVGYRLNTIIDDETKLPKFLELFPEKHRDWMNDVLLGKIESVPAIPNTPITLLPTEKTETNTTKKLDPTAQSFVPPNSLGSDIKALPTENSSRQHQSQPPISNDNSNNSNDDDDDDDDGNDDGNDDKQTSTFTFTDNQIRQLYDNIEELNLDNRIEGDIYTDPSILVSFDTDLTNLWARDTDGILYKKINGKFEEYHPPKNQSCANILFIKDETECNKFFDNLNQNTSESRNKIINLLKKVELALVNENAEHINPLVIYRLLKLLGFKKWKTDSADVSNCVKIESFEHWKKRTKLINNSYVNKVLTAMVEYLNGNKWVINPQSKEKIVSYNEKAKNNIKRIYDNRMFDEILSNKPIVMEYPKKIDPNDLVIKLFIKNFPEFKNYLRVLNLYRDPLQNNCEMQGGDPTHTPSTKQKQTVMDPHLCPYYNVLKNRFNDIIQRLKEKNIKIDDSNGSSFADLKKQILRLLEFMMIAETELSEQLVMLAKYYQLADVIEQPNNPVTLEYIKNQIAKYEKQYDVVQSRYIDIEPKINKLGQYYDM